MVRSSPLTLSLATAALCAVAATPAIAQSARHSAQEDVAVVAERLGREFATAFFVGDPEMALRNLHPALAKSGVQPNIRRSGRDGLLTLSPGTLEIFAKQHNADKHLDPATAPIAVQVLDQGRDVVLFRLTAASDWFDYYLATKINGKWQMVNCVFGPVQHLQLADADAQVQNQSVQQAALDYGTALFAGDAARVRSATHLDFTRRSVARATPSRLLVENSETMAQDLRPRRNGGGEPKVTVLAVSASTAAARIDGPGLREWVFLLKLDGQWRPVNSFWQSA